MTTAATLESLLHPTRALETAMPPSTASPRDGRHDFDFLEGTWRTRNRRLVAPLSGAHDWIEFCGIAVERQLPHGQGNFEEYSAILPDGTPLHAIALRLYEPERRHWTIRWSNASSGTLDAPMTGAFHDGVGEFLSQELYHGQMIFVRFQWTRTGPHTARWEQAFSSDGARTWETNWEMEFERDNPSEIVELRAYDLRPGAREALINLFEREFIEPQELAGMRVMAQFRDLDRPDRFTWLRGFADLAGRAPALHRFYDGPVWAEHNQAANATMINSDNVRLLRRVDVARGQLVASFGRAVTSAAGQDALVVATIYTVKPDVAVGFSEYFVGCVLPLLTETGASDVTVLETDSSTNEFPRLPVREGEHVLVTLVRFFDGAAHARHVRELHADRRWFSELASGLRSKLVAEPEVWRLAPTQRSKSYP